MRKTNRLWLCIAVFLLASQHAAVAQDHATKIQDVLALAHKYRQFNGTALVAENGKVIYKAAFGPANIEWDIVTTQPNSSTLYGLRLTFFKQNGQPVQVITHNGGINGFTTTIVRFPKEKNLIVMLDNTGKVTTD